MLFAPKKPETRRFTKKRNMLAYLISAYRDPAHLARLIGALDDKADFYVHIDANTDDAPFRTALPQKVVFVTRHRVSWGGWEQVEYQREMLKAALESGRPYSHVVCLSGQDYPLWSNRRIREYFAANADREIICGYNITRGTDEGQRKKVTCIHPFRDLNMHSQWLKNKIIVASRNVLKLLGIRRKAQVCIGGKPKDVFFGSDYWALTVPCARHVLETLENEPKMMNYFRRSFVPSELCIQTIVFNSPFAEKALLHEGKYPGLTALTPLHFIDYGACIKVLTLDDLPRLTERGKMFCRKVVTGPSDALADEIDRRRNEEKQNRQ